MKFYAENEDGSIYFYGTEYEDGTWIPAPRFIEEYEEGFPKPECGDYLDLYRMPLDRDGLHATGSAYYCCVSHNTQTNEPVYGWSDEYEDEPEDHYLTCEEWQHVPAGVRVDDGFGGYLTAPEEEGFYILYSIANYKNIHQGFEWMKEE